MDYKFILDKVKELGYEPYQVVFAAEAESLLEDISDCPNVSHYDFEDISDSMYNAFILGCYFDIADICFATENIIRTDKNLDCYTIIDEVKSFYD